MAENEAPVATDVQPVNASAEHTEVAEEAPIAKEDVELAGKQATTEINAPSGDGTAEAAVGPSAVEDTEAQGSADKNKKRKSTGGVPEHKSKKLNRKKSTPSLQLHAKPGQYFWARLKGYAPWPAIIAEESMLSEKLLASRPVSAERPDGSLRDDFKPDGKNAKDRTYPVMFLGTNEFAWMVNTALTPLDSEECKKKPPKPTKGLPEAYELAVEQPDLDYFKKLLAQFQEETAAIEEEVRQREAEAAEKAAAKAEKEESKKAKKPRKSKDAGDDVDMEDAEKPSKKRKKEADGDGDEKPKKIKLNAPKQNGDAAKPASKPKKKIAAPKSDDAAEQKPHLTESERLAQREKGVLYLRHRLQKAFLSSDSAPKEDEMGSMNDFFGQLEGYENLEPAIIKSTKIHKVLKAIIKLNSVPKDDEFNFKKRSQAMLEAWSKSMEANGDAPKPVSEEKTPVTPVVNGDVESTQDVSKEQPTVESKDSAKVDVKQAEKQADELDAKVEKVDPAKPKDEPAGEKPKDTKPDAAAADVDGDAPMTGTEDKTDGA